MPRLTYRIDEGLRIGRQLLLEIRRLGMPTGSEVLDVISSQYLGDLIACGAIGARTTESQLHRELPGPPAPIGVKNRTESIVTDAGLGWGDSVGVLESLGDVVRIRRTG